MSSLTTPQKPLITFRPTRKIADEVRRLAARDEETQSAVLRRLIKQGLEVERRAVTGGEAA